MAEGLVEPRERQSGESPGRWKQPHHHGLELQRDMTDDPRLADSLSYATGDVRALAAMAHRLARRRQSIAWSRVLAYGDGRILVRSRHGSLLGQ